MLYKIRTLLLALTLTACSEPSSEVKAPSQDLTEQIMDATSEADPTIYAKVRLTADMELLGADQRQMIPLLII